MTNAIVVAAILALNSQITDVSVYNDRAQVVRTAEVELQPGINTVAFNDLPEQIDSRSIQVDGSGAATVMDVRVKSENFEEIPKQRWKELYNQKEQLELERSAVSQQIARHRQARAFLDQISSKVTHRAEKEGELDLNPDNWEQMLNLYSTKSTEYDEGIRLAELKLKEIQKSLDKVMADIRDAGADTRKRRQVVEVDVEAAKAGNVILQLSYIVHGPNWTPTYDVRVDTESRKMKVNYFALVRQNTGEDWSDVSLKLSTANPGLGGEHPELDPWRIKIWQPRIQMNESYSAAPARLAKAKMMLNRFAADDAVGFADDAPMTLRETTVSRQGASVVFKVKGTSAIDADNVEHRVAVSSITMPAHFRYSTVPKIDPHAYLKAKAVNSGNHPLLPGSANVFLDGSFVATSSLELVAPDEEFWVFLGADESMKVEHKLIKKYQSREGLMGRETRHTHDYLITVKNTHSVEEEVIVWDQLPISGSEGLKVKLIAPKYTKNSEALEIDDQQRIQWFQTLKPGQEWEIPFSFYVEAPSTEKIDGMD